MIKLKLLLASLCTLAFFSVQAQTYTINPVLMHMEGGPGDLMLDTAVVTNTGSSAIRIFIERVDKNLPPNWQTCFCYPLCVAPFVDTLSWVIPAGGSAKVSPGFYSDPVTPGYGSERVKIYQQGFAANADTLVFSASTMPASVQEISGEIKVYPNPAQYKLILQHNGIASRQVMMYNAEGKLVWESKNISADVTEITVEQLPKGNYFVNCVLQDGRVITKRFSH